MTLQTLLDAVTYEAKLSNDTEAIAELPNQVADIILVLAQSHPELFVKASESALLFSDNPTPYTDALGVLRVTITDPDTGEEIDIPYEDQIVGPPPRPTWPKSYAIDGNANDSAADPKGIRVNLQPAYNINDTLAFTVYWKKTPVISDPTHIVPAAWIPYIKKELLARIAIHRAKGEGDNAKAYMAGSQQALQVEISSNTETSSPTN